MCSQYLDNIQPASRKLCAICGNRVFSAYAQKDDDGLRRFPVCRRIRRPFDRAVGYGGYESGLRERIHLLKYNGIRPPAKVLGGFLAGALAAVEPGIEQLTFEQPAILVIPVPLCKGKLRERGFNQAELIARAALKLRPACERLPLVPDLLVRTRDTAAQICLTSHRRRASLRNSFAVARAAEVTGRQVILVDDVYTTGATATQCAHVLWRAGAVKVWVATVARTLKMASNYGQRGRT